jgi:hypothetical protein
MKRLMRLAVLVTVWMGPAPGEGGQGIAAQSLPGASDTAPVMQQTRTPPAARPLPTRRRRGSMVGYIDDATIESKIRIRLDSGFGTTAPDRAEFFYAKCGCYSGLPPAHPLFDADAPGPLPGAVADLNFQQFVVEGEYRVAPSVSVFGLMPLRWIQPQAFVPGTGGSFSNQSGAGDLRAGAKFALLDREDAGVTAKAQFYFPTGDARKGMGTDHGSFEPALLFHNSVSDRVEIESQVGVWLPIGGAAPTPTAADGTFAGNVFYYGIGPSFTVYERDNVRFAPVVELVGWRVLSGNESVGLDASGTNIVNLKIGGRLNYGRGSVYVGYGHALTDKSWYDDILRLEYRFGF